MRKIVRSKFFLGALIILALIFVYVNYQLSYKGEVTYVSFDSGDITIEGVLTWPKEPGPHPAVILLQGAGGSHQGYDKWYNRFHANALMERGFAVLAYTKRGSGDHDIDYEYTTFEDLIGDALSAVAFLREQPQIDPDNIGMYGISESGWFTPEIAARDRNIRFIINRVSSPLSYNKTTYYEIRQEALEEGYGEEEINEELLPLIVRIREFYTSVVDGKVDPNGPERDSINAEYKRLRDLNLFQEFLGDRLSDYDKAIYQVRASRYTYDPGPFLKELNIPMLYVLAGQDVNIPTKASIEYLNQLKREYKKDITVQVYPDAGHYMYRWKYLPVEGLYEPEYLPSVASWAEGQVDK